MYCESSRGRGEQMVKLPDEVFSAINGKVSEGPGHRGSVGNPHVIQVGSIIAPSPEMIAFGAILMKETSKNLEAMKKKKSGGRYPGDRGDEVLPGHGQDKGALHLRTALSTR